MAAPAPEPPFVLLLKADSEYPLPDDDTKSHRPWRPTAPSSRKPRRPPRTAWSSSPASRGSTRIILICTWFGPRPRRLSRPACLRGVSPSQAGPSSADVPLLAPPHCWRSSSGWASRVDHRRRHHCYRLPVRGWGLAEPSWATLRRRPPSSPRRTAGARPRAGLLASTTAAVTTVAVSPHGVGVSPSQAGPCSADDPRPRPAAPLALVLGLGFLRRPPPPSPLLPFPRMGLGSRRAKLGHVPPTTPDLAPQHRWRSSLG